MAHRLPLFPLGTVLFPGAALPLHVFEQRYRTMVEDLLVLPEPRSFAVVAIREGHEVGADSVRALYEVGCVATIRQLRRMPDGRYSLVATGGSRFRLLDLDQSRPYAQVDVEFLDEPLGDAATVRTAQARTRAALARYVGLMGAAASIDLPDDPTELSYAVASAVVVDLPERQGLLAADDTARRLASEAELLAREVALLRTLQAAPMPRPPLGPSSLN